MCLSVLLMVDGGIYQHPISRVKGGVPTNITVPDFPPESLCCELLLGSYIMKISVSLLLPAFVTAAILDTRQTPQYKVTTTELTPRFRSNSKRTVTRIGPLNLLPGVS